MEQTYFAPGCTVRDKEGKQNFGLPMNVIGEKEQNLIVAFVNLDGNYQEGLLSKEHAIQESAQVTIKPGINPAFY